MSTEKYTPTTENRREYYVAAKVYESFINTIRAEAWDEGMKAATDFVCDPAWVADPVNPYRKAAGG